ncbi:MAG TPA: RluA family pseudouridine synthase [Lachnospiraceae bacterium]|nr:RluA family pseudouridine synthase [Lachnospiraceae bacterium]
MKEIIIDSSAANQRFDKFLKKYFSASSNGFIYKMLRKKNIILNDKKDDGSSILLEGDTIKVFFSDETFDKMRGLDNSADEYNYLKRLNYNLDVIYEDDNIIACNKPAGMLSQKSKASDISINEYIISYLINERNYSIEDYRLFHPSISNRLDYNTTGVILGAKTLQGQQELSLALKERTIDKYYICIVKGKVAKDILLKGSLTKNKRTNMVKIIADGNEPQIETDIKVISSNNDISLLRIHLITGKTHQIRAHLSSINHPIIGDIKYGDNKINNYYKDKYNLNSQALHSYITIYKEIEIKAPLPEVMKQIIEDKYGNMEF